MQNPLIVFQIVVSILLITVILLQQRGTALGSAFGQEGGTYGTRRGVQKKLFWAAVVLGATFILLAFFNLIL